MDRPVELHRNPRVVPFGAEGGAMRDEPKAEPTPAPEAIRVDDPYDLLDWAIYFSVSRERIREAVAAVGPVVEDVKRYLGKDRRV